MKKTNIKLLAEKIESDPDSVIEDLVAVFACPYEFGLNDQLSACENSVWKENHKECIKCWNE